MTVEIRRITQVSDALEEAFARLMPQLSPRLGAPSREVLRRVAGSVVGVLAAADRYLFRFGGEEFVAILPDIGEEEARRIAGALLDAVRAAAVPREDLPDRHIVTASFGVACGTGRELKDFSLIAKADRQLYICKNNGKNCVAASGAIYR